MATRKAPKILLPFLVLLATAGLALVPVFVMANTTDIATLMVAGYGLSLLVNAAVLAASVWLAVNIIRRVSFVASSDKVRKVLKTAQEFRK